MKRRQFLFLFGAGSAAATSVGTGAFSSVEAERGVSVDVVDDEDAYLGIEQIEDTITVGQQTEVAELKNQSGENLELVAKVDSKGHSVEIDGGDNVQIVEEFETDEESGEESDDDDDIHPGGTAHVDVTCDEAGEDSFTLSIRGTLVGSDGTDDAEGIVDATRTFTVECTGTTEAVTKVKFPGNSGKVRILTTDDNGGGGGTDGTVDAKLYYGSDDVSSSGFESVHVNTDLREDDFNTDVGANESIRGVEIKRIDGVFVKPDTGNGNGNTVSPDETETDPFE